MLRVKRKIKDRPILGPSFIKKLLREDYDYGTDNVNGTDIFDITKTGMTFYNQLLPSADDETKKYMENRKGIVGHIEYMTPQEYYDDAARIHRTTAYNLKQQREYDRDIIDKLKDVITNKKKKFPITFLSFSKNYKGQEGLHRMYAAAELFGWDDVKFPVLVIEDASWTVSEKISNINVKEKNFKRSEKSLELNEVYPNKGESKKDFISRFMSVTKDEYPDRKQRYAVALSYWNRRNENLTEEKIAYLPKEHIDAINNKYKDYYKNYSIEKVAISDLLKDDPGLNDYNDLGSYHEIIWGDDVSKYRYDPKKNTNPSDVPSVVYKNDKYYINDGRHRIKALANSGYDYVELPVLREDVLTEAKEDIGETVEALVQNNTVINSKIYNYSSVNTVIIPEGVTSIGNSAFYNCDNLTHIAIPDSVTSIGTLAFAYCSNLTDIELPDNITSIDYGAFEHCSKLESIKLPTSLIDIGHSAFFNCRSLTNIEIPNTVTGIGQQSFWGCINLTKILIPDSVTSIEAGAFEMCTNLKHVDMSNNVKSISKFIFNSCGSLTNITIPEGVTRIEEGAFFNCENLKNIKLPNSLTSIGSGAFSGCTSLTSIEIPESVTTIYPYAFRGCQNLTIYREATKKPDGWKRDWNPDKRPVIRGYKGEAKQEKLSPKKRKSRNILVYNAGDVDAGIAMFNHAAAAESLHEDENDYTNLSSSQLENLLFNDLFSEKNLTDTFKSINILPAVTDNVPKGPSFITRDGKFIDVMRTSDFIDRSKFTNRFNYSVLTHYDWLKLITEALFGSKLRAYRDMLQIVTDKLGWVRCNTGESPEEDRFYCVVPDRSESRMAPKQYDSLEKYLIYGKNKNKEVLVFGGDAGNISNSYSLRDPYYIIEKIKDYYRTGILMENIQFSNTALSRMDKYVNIIKNKNNLALLDGRDTPICYASAINNLFYFYRLGKDCTLHLGTFDDTGNTIVHAWVECEGKIYQTAEPKNKPKNYKLKSLKQIEISKDMSEDDIEKAVKGLYQNTGESLKEDIEIHNTLNSKFWKDNELKAEVREKIEAIVERFKTYLNDKNIKIDVKDILLLGSNASYNYTDDSDLDIHIIVEPKEITEDEKLLKQLYDLAASAFNDKFNITLKNSDAEVYVELNDTDAHSNGIYSLEKGWIKEPVKDELKNVELDKDELNKWKKRYLSVLKEKDAKKIKKFIAELYKLRKDSIAADGEYSQGNLIFKEMRNLGYISKLKDLLDEIESEELSLEKLNEAKEDIQKFVDKFGQDIYDWFIKSKDRLKNNKISTDILYHVKNTSIEDMQNILHNLQAKTATGDLTKIQGKYNYIGEKDGYKIYQPLDALASMNLGTGSGWCTTGRYGHYGDTNFKPSLRDAEKHWDKYTSNGIKFYYLLDATTMLAKYAIAVYPRTLKVDKVISDYYVEQTNFEIYNAEDKIDYKAYIKLKDILELLSENIIFKADELPTEMTAEVRGDTVIQSRKYINAQKIIIPDNVTYIGTYAFSECEKLKTIEIPNTVTFISDYAFHGCSSLNNIIIPDSVTSIGKAAFAGCTSLTDVKLSNALTSIKGSTFASCTKLKDIKLPDNVTVIGDSAFDGCESLTNIEIPSNVTSIGSAAFNECKNITSIEIPDGVIAITMRTFDNCSGLKDIKLPDSIKYIGERSFRYCTNLKGIKLPDNVIYIGYSAFYHCTNLKNIIIPYNVKKIDDYAFGKCNKLTIYCETESKPKEWYREWNPEYQPVVWGYKGK